MRHVARVAACASLAMMLSACPFVMEDQFVIAEDGVDAGPTGGKGGSGATGGANTGGAKPDTGHDAPIAPDTTVTCGVPAPNANATCPWGCECPDTKTCIIRCMGNESCRDDNIQCPLDRNCKVVCEGDKACEKAKIKCAGGGSCDVDCGDAACKELETTCATGPCTLSCPLGCEAAKLRCGTNSCDAICGPVGPLPTVECGASCDCSAC